MVLIDLTGTAPENVRALLELPEGGSSPLDEQLVAFAASDEAALELAGLLPVERPAVHAHCALLGLAHAQGAAMAVRVTKPPGWALPPAHAAAPPAPAVASAHAAHAG